MATPIPRRVVGALSTLLLCIVTVAGFAGPAHAEDGYRYWNYFHLQDKTWAFSDVGPADYKPEDGDVESQVVWESGRFFGCKFRSAVSQAAVSGALLQSEPRAAPARPVAPVGGVLRGSAIKLGPELNFSAAVAMSLLLWGAIVAGGYLIFG